MTRTEVNELLIGVGVLGIACYFLWPKHPVPVDAGDQAMAGQVERLGGISVPTLPGYLSSNRPAFAIQPEPFRMFSNPAFAPELQHWGDRVRSGDFHGLPQPAAHEADAPHGGCCC